MTTVLDVTWGGPGLDDDGAMVVATVDGQAVGFLELVDHQEGVLWLHRLYVQRSHRRRGIARRLLERAQLLAEARGARSLEGGVYVTNTASAALFRSMGYQRAEQFSGNLGVAFIYRLEVGP